MTYESFLSIANTALGAVAGALIGAPVAAGTASPGLGTALLVAFTILGAASGYRRRQSRGFLYLSLLVVLVLAGMLSLALFQPT